MPVVVLAIILGLVQALTEFLPVSSSGHLILARTFLDFDVVDGLTFDVAVHIGTLMALVVYFHRDLVDLTRGFLASIARRSLDAHPMSRLAWYALAACVPTGLAGLLFEAQIEAYFRHPSVIVVTLVAGAILFLWVERAFRSVGEMRSLSLRHAVAIGLAQVLSLVPGVSRSGITIAVGMMAGLRRDEAARFSFLMVTPLLLGIGLKKSFDLTSQPISPDERTALIVGIVTSGLAGWLVIRFLISYLRNNSLKGFAYYRIALAAVVFVWMLRG